MVSPSTIAYSGDTVIPKFLKWSALDQDHRDGDAVDHHVARNQSPQHQHPNAMLWAVNLLKKCNDGELARHRGENGEYLVDPTPFDCGHDFILRKIGFVGPESCPYTKNEQYCAQDRDGLFYRGNY